MTPEQYLEKLFANDHAPDTRTQLPPANPAAIIVTVNVQLPQAGGAQYR